MKRWWEFGGGKATLHQLAVDSVSFCRVFSVQRHVIEEKWQKKRNGIQAGRRRSVWSVPYFSFVQRDTERPPLFHPMASRWAHGRWQPRLPSSPSHPHRFSQVVLTFEFIGKSALWGLSILCFRWTSLTVALSSFPSNQPRKWSGWQRRPSDFRDMGRCITPTTPPTLTLMTLLENISYTF